MTLRTFSVTLPTMSLAPADHLASSFTPVRVRARADGWTEERQRGFIRALVQDASVTRAAAAVGMSRKSAYRLAARKHARSFVRAWRVAQQLAQPLPPQREDLWGLHIVDRRKRGLARRPVSDGRLCRLMRPVFARVEREARVRNELAIREYLKRESYSGGEELRDRCGNSVTFQAPARHARSAHSRIRRSRPSGRRGRTTAPAGRRLIRPPPFRDAGRGVP